jgi:hypothetical protein
MRDWLNKYTYARTPRQFFRLAAVIEEKGGSATAALGYIVEQTLGGRESRDGGWEYPEWVQVKLQDLADWIGGCINTAYRAIQRCVKLGVIQTRKVGLYLEARLRIDRWERVTMERRKQIQEQLEADRIAREKRKAATIEEAETEEPEAETVCLAEASPRAALRVVAKAEGERCPASSHCPFFERSRSGDLSWVSSEKEKRKFFASCSPSFADSKEVIEPTITTCGDGCSDGSETVDGAIEAKQRRKSIAIKEALRARLTPISFENWIAPAEFKLNGAPGRPVLTVSAHALEIELIQSEYAPLVLEELAKLGVNGAEILYEVIPDHGEAEALSEKSQPSLPDDTISHAYFVAVRGLIDQHRIEERLGQVLDWKFVADQVARVCVPIAHLERAFAEKARKFTKPGFLTHIFDDSIGYSRQALRQAVLASADSEHCHERA